jgi:regulatory protein
VAKTPHEELAARIAELESSGRVSHGLSDDRDSAAVPRRGAELVARGAEASSTSEARTQAELDALRDARAGRHVIPDSSGAPDLGGPGAPDEFGTADPTDPDAPVLPSRDVNDVRGPSLVSLEGQLAHDEALGVGPDGREIAPPRPKRQKKAKPAELAFTEVLPHQKATDLAYKLVSRREHTVKQVRDKLAKKECEPASIDAAVAELERHNFVDDRRYAKLFAEDKRRLQGWGARRIRMALTQDGISRDLLDELFADDEEALDAPSEMEVALDVLRRKQPDLSDMKVRSRMANLLARRGIASSTVFAAIRQHQKNEAE